MLEVSDVSFAGNLQLTNCEQRIGYVFKDKQKLLSALTHASGAQNRLASNERMEFLGDAILGAVVCDMLFHQFPDSLEGNLTKIKSIVVSRHTCAKICERLDLESSLIVGKGMASTKKFPRSLLSDLFESIVAAIYLDGGMHAAREFIVRFTQPEIDLAASGVSDDNFKSQLQQIVQKDFGGTPSYALIEEKGPDHKKSFRIAAKFDGREFPSAWGENKKKAEQRAAGNALAALNGEEPPFEDVAPNK